MVYGEPPGVAAAPVGDAEAPGRGVIVGSGVDGNGKRARGPSSARRAQLARSRRCPKCDRGAALSSYDDGVLTGVACRWCDYARLREQSWTRRIGAETSPLAEKTTSTPEAYAADTGGTRS